MRNKSGCIYILTNPSFPKFVKIGYADDVYQRLNQLNRSECIPYAFRLYAYYEVASRLTDMKLHSMIDRLNPNLRAIDDFNGKKRVREFYAMEAKEAYNILETIAELNGMQQNLHLVKPTQEEVNAEEEAAEITGVSINRHHFKNCVFTSSLTGKTYKGTTSELGLLSIIDVQTNLEVPNNSNPSKKSIIGQAILDLGGKTDKEETLYQRYRKLTKLLENKIECEESNIELIEQRLISKVSSNDVRVYILRLPKEVQELVDKNTNLITLKLGSLSPTEYKYNPNGRFVSGVSKFYKECGFSKELAKEQNLEIEWIIKDSTIEVIKKS